MRECAPGGEPGAPSRPGRWDIERDSASNVDDSADYGAGTRGKWWSRSRLLAGVTATAAVIGSALGVSANASQTAGVSLKDLAKWVHWGEPTPSPQNPKKPKNSLPGTTPSAPPSGPQSNVPPSTGQSPGPQSPGPQSPGPQSPGAQSPGSGLGGSQSTDPRTDADDVVQSVDSGSNNNSGSTNKSTKRHTKTPVVVPTTPPQEPTNSTLKQEAPTASIESPANGLTTTATSVSLHFSISPTTAPSGWVWYVVVQPAHHLASDFMTKIRPGSSTMAVGVGPATGGSGATDDYQISVALINATAAQRIGSYSDSKLAPDDTRFLDHITVHRRPST